MAMLMRPLLVVCGFISWSVGLSSFSPAMAGVPDLVFSLVLGAMLWVSWPRSHLLTEENSRGWNTRVPRHPHAVCEYVMRTGCLLAVVDTDEFRKLLDGSHAPAPFDDHFRSIVSTSSRDGLQCGPAMFQACLPLSGLRTV